MDRVTLILCRQLVCPVCAGSVERAQIRQEEPLRDVSVGVRL
jgi:hypothetical protein